MATYALLASKPTAKILEEHNAMVALGLGAIAGPEHLGPATALLGQLEQRSTLRGRLFPRFDLVTMVSEQDREYCLETLPGYTGPMAVVPNGVDCEHNEPSLAVILRPASLVFNGSLSYDANYDAMRLFLAEIFPQDPERKRQRPR